MKKSRSINSEIENNIKSEIENNIKSNIKNEFLANLVFIFHCTVILFVLFAPFSNIPAFLILHIVFSFCILIGCLG